MLLRQQHLAHAGFWTLLATLPMPSLSVGTSRQPINVRPSASIVCPIALRQASRLLISLGKKTKPVAYSPVGVILVYGRAIRVGHLNKQATPSLKVGTNRTTVGEAGNIDATLIMPWLFAFDISDETNATGVAVSGS